MVGNTPEQFAEQIKAEFDVYKDVVKKRIEDTGSLVVGNTPEQFAEQIKAEFDIYKDVVKKQDLKLD